MKYKCPICKSTDIHGWREDVVETRYKLTREGKLYSRPYKTFYNGADGHEGLVCNNCGEIVNWVNGYCAEWEL